MKIELGSKLLVTTNEWFYGGDGRAYRSVWGTVKAVLSSEETLGVRTNAKSTNWYVEIGDTVIAGCQIHYAIRTSNPPPAKVAEQHVQEGKAFDYTRDSFCWNADAGDMA